jgi:hypothetical protein
MQKYRDNPSVVPYAVVFTSFVNPFLSAAINVALLDHAVTDGGMMARFLSDLTQRIETGSEL